MVRSLSIHADYRCRHAGACCTAGWPIPVDEGLEHALSAAVRRNALPAASSTPAPLFLTAPDGHPSIGNVDGACVFYEGRTTKLCAIHRELGEEYLPPPCRHFPRIALLDPRGVSITLSHYCPTAAGLLFREDVQLSIVQSPAAFPDAAAYEGLDARGVLPPLLRPGLLCDLEGYSRWEACAVAIFARADVFPERALDLLRRAALDIERWEPARGPLAVHVSAAFGRLPAPPGGRSKWGEDGRAVSRYLAARLFASWVPYRSQRLLDLVDDVARAHDLLASQAAHQDLTGAIRATDLQIVHGR